MGRGGADGKRIGGRMGRDMDGPLTGYFFNGEVGLWSQSQAHTLHS